MPYLFKIYGKTIGIFPAKMLWVSFDVCIFYSLIDGNTRSKSKCHRLINQHFYMIIWIYTKCQVKNTDFNQN